MALDYVKLVVVGDGAVGKTSLLTSFVSGGFPEEHVPTGARPDTFVFAPRNVLAVTLMFPSLASSFTQCSTTSVLMSWLTTIQSHLTCGTRLVQRHGRQHTPTDAAHDHNTHSRCCLAVAFAGQEDYDNLRPMSYGGSHVVMMCFSLVDASSLSNIRAKWFPEVRPLHRSRVCTPAATTNALTNTSTHTQSPNRFTSMLPRQPSS